MKNLYNTIEQNLKAGLNIVIKDLRDNSYCAIGTNKDNGGNYRYSGWEKNIKDAKQFIGSCCGYDKDYWNEFDLEIVEVYRPEFEPFKVGDKVRILDSIKKTEDWEEYKDYFPDMTGEIEEACLYVEGTRYSINDWWIGHEYLTLLNEAKEDNIALEAIKLLEEKGYKIIKK